MQGQADAALPQIEERLSKIEGWWTASRAGLPTPDAPNREVLARVIIGALDIARQANYALEQWEAALKRIDTVMVIEQELKRPPQDIAGTRMNRANVLRELKRYSEAKLELEVCLDIFENDPVNRATVVGSLAHFYYEIGDLPQAITQARRALTLCNTLPEPRERAISHEHLSVFLRDPGEEQNLAESARHGLANFVYVFVTGLAQHLETSFRHHVVFFRTAASARTEPNIPRLAELLDDPAFVALKEWLAQRQGDLDDLQAARDQILDQARQAARQSSPR